MVNSPSILTPDQKLRVFVSSTLQELADERKAARRVIERLRLAPIMFELGARPHPPRALYRAYLEQSHIFLGIYWQSYGWVAPGEEVSGLEDEYNLSSDKPKLIYVKAPAPDRQPRLKQLLDRIKGDDRVSYKAFTTARELGVLIEADLVLLLTERFHMASRPDYSPAPATEPSPPEHPAKLYGFTAQVTPLVGRKDEIAAVQELLRHAEVRLVTLSGPGGTGKTRLAIEVAEQMQDDFPDGAFFVPLALSTIPRPYSPQ